MPYVPPVGVVDLDLRGTPGGTDLDLGGAGSDDRSISVSATTARPSGAVSVVRGPALQVAATTARPSAFILAAIPNRARMDATTAAPTAHVRVVGALSLRVVATTARPRAEIAAAYDPNLLSDMVASASEGWAGTLLRDAAAPIRIDPGSPVALGLAGAWRDAGAASGGTAPGWMDSPREAGGGRASWREGDAARWDMGLAWSQSARADHGGRPSWRDGVPARLESTIQWVGRPRGTHSARPDWAGAGRATGGIPVGGLRDGPRIPAATLPKWNDATLVAYVWRPPPGPKPPAPWEHWGNNLCLVQPLGLPLDLGWYGCRDWTGWRIPRRRSYIVVHDIEVVRLPDRYPIAVAALTISLDADAWAWSWSGTLLGAAALEAVIPSGDEPVTLEASIDGYLWHLLVEEWSEDRAFGSRAVRATGRGLTAWLAAPYQLPGSGISAVDRTVAQLLEAHLPEGEGWTITWEADVPDWTVPGGAWSWAQQAPISAIHAAAQGVGLIVVPSRTLRVLHIQPRYRVLPWDYVGAEPDLTIPDSAILQLTRQRQAKAQANGVYVHGGEVGGYQALVRRTGTDGARQANTQSSPLIASTGTDVAGARLLGSRILAAHEAQPEVRSITLPLGGVFPLQELGDLIELEIGQDLIRGTVSGLQVQVATAGAGQSVTVRQTLTLGEETPNQWAKFSRLLPGDPLLVGEATTVHADGTVTVTLIGGGTVRVRGEATEGQMVYVRGGRIEGEAPQLTAYEIDV
jgi:hypothetical protein